jgi:hypothetical protein
MPDDEVKKITTETQRPRGSFPGRVEIGYYVVVEGNVVLTDEQGKPIGVEGTKRCLGPNDDARIQACLMLRQRTRSIARARSFNGPINYGATWKGV